MNNSSDKGKASPAPVRKKRYWVGGTLFLLAVILVAGLVVFVKAGSTLNRISTKGGIVKSIMRSLPGAKDILLGEEEGRINVALFGMRGEDLEGGGYLADTIMIVSIKPKENKVSMVSVPRDLEVMNPIWNRPTKINAVYAAAEEKGRGEGIEAMKKVLGDITGLPIHYGISISFKGFKDVVDALGGVEIHLDKPFKESLQFRGLEKRCDSNYFTVPSGNYETKKQKYKHDDGTAYYVEKKYPLCYPEAPAECGGIFELPAGDVTLSGERALCFARSRTMSSDFERAKRQQQILQSIKDKALSLGTLTDFEKVSSLLDAMGNNILTDMAPWEMKRFLGLAQNIKTPEIVHKVLDNSEAGLLYDSSSESNGYILLPRGESYDRIRQLFQSVI